MPGHPRPFMTSPALVSNSPDPAFKSVELAQRARMILDVAAADLEVAEARLGPFHETTWHFRNRLAESRRSWDRLRANFGSAALDSALAEPPRSILVLGETSAPPRKAIFITIAGKTYRVERLPTPALALSLWRLTRLPLSGDCLYYLARLHDGTYDCDCAEWAFQVAEIEGAQPCKHVSGLRSLGWI